MKLMQNYLIEYKHKTYSGENMGPIIIVNFKTYEAATGEQALKLAKIHNDVAIETGAGIMVAVQNADIFRISSALSIPILAQHTDPVEYGSNTGHDMPECLKANGAAGTLINHSEDRMNTDGIAKVIQRCRGLGMISIVCAESIKRAKEIIIHKPDYIAFEDPELIGTGKSVSANEPESVKAFADMVIEFNGENDSKIIPLCGAGISNGDDIKKSVDLGMKGVLLASAVTKAKNPKEKLLELAKSMD